jgi:uncharacterized protein YlzI (FlbEa/FlbD family)
MNKRQRKKLDNKLKIAIRELNDDIAMCEGFPLITDEQVEEVLTRVKKSKQSINSTLRDHKRFIHS